MATLIPLVEIPPALVEELLDAAFGADRRARTAYRLREGAAMLEGLSFAAVDQMENELLGSLQCWPIALVEPDGTRHPAIMVGPVAVHPEMQGQGIGGLMMDGLFEQVAANHPPASGANGGTAPHPPLVLIGDPDYYAQRFGFSAARTGGWSLPGPWEPSRLMVRASDDAALPATARLEPWAQP